MPRIFSPENEPMDYCKRCFPHAVKKAVETGKDYDTENPHEHPPYDSCTYRCDNAFCNTPLREEDD